MDGTPSDHSIVAASCALPKCNKPIKSSFKFCPITTEGIEKFRELLTSQDWEKIKGRTASDSASKLDEVLQGLVKRCFPEKKNRQIRSTDAPWFNNRIRRAVQKKRRIYKEQGKSEKYHEARRACEQLIRIAKKNYLGCIIDRVKFAGNTRDYYKAVKMLRTKEAPIVWNICSMFPGESEGDISEKVADFFNIISQEYEPLPNPATLQTEHWTNVLEPYQVAARLRTFRKPKSQVPGDINPELVSKFYDLIAEPLCHVFNQSLGTLSWPSLWKSETVSIIPKNSAPSSLSELRNLSCTPLFSLLFLRGSRARSGSAITSTGVLKDAVQYTFCLTLGTKS